jgi:hypothetical protein
VLLVRTTEEQVFGAFTPCAWLNDVQYQYEEDPSSASFLFTIKRQPRPLSQDVPENATNQLQEKLNQSSPGKSVKFKN